MFSEKRFVSQTRDGDVAPGDGILAIDMMRGKVKRKGVGTRIENLTLVGVEF